MCMYLFFLQKTHDEQLLPWDVILTLLFSCCSRSVLGICLTTGEKQCDFHKQYQIFAWSARDVSPSLIKGNAIRTDAVGNHNPFSQQYETSESGGAQFLLLAWNTWGNSWLLLQFCFRLIHSGLPRGCSLKFVVFVVVKKGCLRALRVQQACAGHRSG